MKLHSYHLKNFRRLQDVHIELTSDISIFVGANNSGKTSATQAVDMFINGGKSKFSIFDFSSPCWEAFNSLTTRREDDTSPIKFPTISLDLWFEVQRADWYKVIPLLPSADWDGTLVGLRIEFLPKNAEELIAHFNEAKQKTTTYRPAENSISEYLPWPRNMTDYLSKDEKLQDEYEFRYFVLDRTQYDGTFKPIDEETPNPLATDVAKGIIKALLRVDCLNAQRHLTDAASSVRAEDLSKCLSRFYKRNLEKREDDHDAFRALFDSELQLNEHLARVFQPTLEKLSRLGYPGFSNPQLVIKSTLNPSTIMNQETEVHYSLNSSPSSITLPDSYNGLGFKNLIYMVVEILDLQARWVDEEENRASLHLIFIEEPEAHLHAQLQQVFIRKVLGLLEVDGDDPNVFKSQMVVTTHSSHILYEGGFRPIRYFRRETEAGSVPTSTALSLMEFYNSEEPAIRDFLERYLKLTHCDLFFADAAVLVEGNVERLLLPTMIEKASSTLNSAYVCTLEVGGAFAHRFKKLIEFLGLPTLIITDLDSVLGGVVDENTDDEDGEESRPGTICLPSVADSVTSNPTLKSWLPELNLVSELLTANPDSRTQNPSGNSKAKVFVVYQKLQNVSWNGEQGDYAGRTFEETFCLTNISWTQENTRKPLKLKLRSPSSLSDFVLKLHKRVIGKSFNKTNFALALLSENPEQWEVPPYIVEGLNWINSQVIPALDSEAIVEAAILTSSTVAQQTPATPDA